MNFPAALRDQARSNENLGSPFTANLLRVVAAQITPDTPLTARMFNWPGDISSSGASVPLRFLGGLQALVLSGKAPALAAIYPPNPGTNDATLWLEIQKTMADHSAFFDQWLNNAPQTNEVRRAAILIATGHWLADHYGLPMNVSELGASGGLNLMWDRFGLDISGHIYGPKDPAFTLTPDWSGPLPPTAKPRILERRGIDLNPLDPHDPADHLALTSYLWADQPERLARTKATIQIANAVVDKGDAAAWLKARLATTKPDQLHLVYHTIAWQYFPPATQAACETALNDAGARATDRTPLARLSMEADGGKGAALTLWLWPEDLKINLGRVDFHGRWVEWQAG